ncbi:MAG: alanine-glyoxylate transaminase / serine-glyoxylate transaminase / serine-pyruvate transaminase [Archaeoglobi archaeon]|nr:alanine-glyoxylate transaminase / serine-glyoxylate transaminase / serine-pyruvate transaminase [Archaeoglobi archaeon]
MIERRLLMIPGPVENSPEVLMELGKPPISHMDPEFASIFGEALRDLREVFQTSGQPFVVAGSGTLAMEMSIVNVVERGERVLIVSNGLFGDRFKDICERHGYEYDILRAPAGERVSPERIEEMLESGEYKAVTVTHVDTSTGVRTDIKEIGEITKRSGALLIVDDVCGTGGEMMKMDEWNVDVIFTGSQKGLGIPPGLAITVFSERALSAWDSRRTPVESYYCDIGLWMPVMEAYERGEAKYFATPATNMIRALWRSLKILLEEGIEKRVRRHQIIGETFREAIKAMNMKIVPKSDEIAANTLTVISLPNGIDDPSFRKEVRKRGVVLAGGLGELAGKTTRIGHIGLVDGNEVFSTIGAIEGALQSLGHDFEVGSGLRVASEKLLKL